MLLDHQRWTAQFNFKNVHNHLYELRKKEVTDFLVIMTCFIQ